MKAAVYSRISRDAEDEGKGVDRQEEDCLALVQSKGWTLTGTYRDNDTGAAGKAKHRPQYEAMLAAAKAGDIDVLVAYSNSRLTRRPLELEALIDLHNTHSTQIHTVVSGNDDLSTADGRMVARLKGNIDAAEAERTAERITRQKKQRAEEGLPQGGRYRVFGYNRAWEVMDDEAALVKEAFTRRAAGESTKAIADDFAARGVVTTSNKTFKSQTLDHMFRNAGYAGRRIYNGKHIGKTAYPTIITEALYDAVQDAMTLNARKGTNARRWLLSGVLQCSKCLSPMTGKAASNNKSNARKAHYKCAEAYGGCGNVSIVMDPVDNAVFNAAFMKAQQADEAPVDVRDYQSEIDALEARIKDTQAAYTSGQLDIQDATPILADLRKTKQALTKEAQTAAANTSLGAIKVGLFDWWEYNLSQKRLYIGEYISTVVVAPWDKTNPKEWRNRLTIHYKDGTTGHVTEGVVVDTLEGS